MRIISGKFKGRKLVSFPNKNIRPTSDRAKEMIFSTLHSILKKKQKSFDKLKILDCFCGSGSLGIECISRGCQDVHFIDNSYESIEITTKNCKRMDIENFSKFYKSDFRNKNLPALRVDLFFLDPPYEKFKIINILETLYKLNLVKEKALGVLEVPKSNQIKELNEFSVLKERRVSNSLFYFIIKN